MTAFDPVLRDAGEPAHQASPGAGGSPHQASAGAAPGRPAPRADGRPPSLAARASSAVAGLHAVAAALVLTLVAYVALAAVTVTVGLVLGSSAFGSVDRWDESVNRWFVRERTSTGDGVSGVVSAMANTLTALPVAAVVVIGLWRAHRWKGAVLLFVALSLEVAVFLTTTVLMDRERPEVPLMDEAPPTSSFPSGHTAAAVALYLGLALLASRLLDGAVARAALVVFAGLVPLAVGLARLYRGMHHPTDVAGGLALGAACLVAALLVVRMVDSVVVRRSPDRGVGAPA